LGIPEKAIGFFEDAGSLSRIERKLSKKERKAIKREGRAAAPAAERKTFSLHDLKPLKPFTTSQTVAINAFKDGQHLVLHGMAGTGKTYLAISMALRMVLDPNTPYERMTMVRSVVPTRDVGFLPGSEAEKIAVYELPYHAICDELFPFKKSYDNMKKAGLVQFISTSFIRGVTLNDTIVIVDECENLTFHELDSIITRCGSNCRIIFCGDVRQTDLNKSRYDTCGLDQFMGITKRMESFTNVEFSEEDIVRSGLVKDYIIKREGLDLKVEEERPKKKEIPFTWEE
jgi:predicted ribonuclease YlaK